MKNQDLKTEIKKALKTQPKWVIERAINNITKYKQGKLVTKYDSKHIKPLKEKDVINSEKLHKKQKQKLTELGKKHLQQSKFSYFVMAGGISTSMGGCSKAILHAKNNLTFLEIKLNHVRAVQKKYNCKIPFILMTNEETDKSITQFLIKQNRLEDIDLIKIIQPVTTRFKEAKGIIEIAKNLNGTISYVPGGHYDSFILLKKIKQKLEKKGIQTIFINNIDNLGATIDPLLLGIHIQKKSLFTPEIAKKEPNDKGGTFARIQNKLRLLEGPMVPENYKETFNDTKTHKYFNTNLIYLDIKIFKHFKEINDQIPTFLNKKSINQQEVFGFEAAIGLVFGIKKSTLINVKRQYRFLPIKFLSDLWLLRSDFMKLKKTDWSVYQVKKNKPQIRLPETFISNLEEFEKKIADGGETTHFKELEKLSWTAKDGKIGSNVTFKGNITITEKNSTIKNNQII